MRAYFIKENCLERVGQDAPGGYALIVNNILICSEEDAASMSNLLDGQLGDIKHKYLAYINPTFILGQGQSLIYTYRLRGSKGLSSLTVAYCDGDSYIEGFEGSLLIADSHPDFWQMMMSLANAIRVPKLEMARFMWNQDIKFEQQD